MVKSKNVRTHSKSRLGSRMHACYHRVLGSNKAISRINPHMCELSCRSCLQLIWLVGSCRSIGHVRNDLPKASKFQGIELGYFSRYARTISRFSSGVWYSTVTTQLPLGHM